MLRYSYWLLAVGFWLLVSCGSEPTANSQEPIAYSSPVDYDIVLAGNFGEPRPWHFHGGIDVKTDNQEGKNIFSIADGYVSRLTVNMYGFGNAIYVSHPDGNTSVYCHLKRFADRYEQMLQRTSKCSSVRARIRSRLFFPKRCFLLRQAILLLSAVIRDIVQALIFIWRYTILKHGLCATPWSS